MRQIRINICLVVLVLLGMGSIMIYSASSIYAWNNYGDSFYYFKRHIFYLFCGIILMAGAMSLSHEAIRRMAKPLLCVSFVLLIFNLIPGISNEVSGARRWIKIGPVGFQPSEFLKIVFIVYLADFIARKKSQINDFAAGIMPAAIALGFPTLLILMQPDLGTAVSLVSVAVIMLFSAGLRVSYFVYAALASMPVLYFLVFSIPYRRARILAFLDPWSDPMGKGFQIIQSQIALGVGGFLGQGLGQGKQKLFYLPAAHTDFIFSVIGEEMGIVGGIAVIALFIFLIWQMIKIVKANNDMFMQFLSLGIVALISLEAVINIGVSIGMFPTKGLPLPFMSYGGSSLVFNLVALGLLLNASRGQEICL